MKLLSAGPLRDIRALNSHFLPHLFVLPAGQVGRRPRRAWHAVDVCLRPHRREGHVRAPGFRDVESDVEKRGLFLQLLECLKPAVKFPSMETLERLI